MTTLRVLRAHDYRRMAWKNGGGITTEIARRGDGDAFDWRVSVAEIAQDGDFSIFPDVDRELMLLDGGGVELAIGSDEPVALTRRYQKHAFPGEAPVSCRLIDGPTRDFNLMVRRGHYAAELIARPIVGAQLLFPAAGTTWLVFVANGHVLVNDRSDVPRIEGGETLLIEFMQSGGSPLVLNGAGEIVLVKLNSRESGVENRGS
ncbi:MAG TPA: HutD family protein [Tahibacter sp.]|uniref:HutD/Ves family protein n=1 Tax=Tahibacter sp. TaxID=2056211 RepID=UPI002B8FB19A|nr:HutD family protein [Tahibacter sp.]HSX61158.1 HutD family protein [Tahibacter sp.]